MPSEARWESLRAAAMNLAIRGTDFNLGREPGDTFTGNQQPDLRADYQGQHALQGIVTGSAQLKFNKTNLRSLPGTRVSAPSP